jgi:hypothetical protein
MFYMDTTSRDEPHFSHENQSPNTHGQSLVAHKKKYLRLVGGLFTMYNKKLSRNFPYPFKWLGILYYIDRI